MTPLKKIAIPLLLLFIFSAFVSKDEDPLDRLVASLRQWTDTHPQEKVYLHMDKPYYALGDTIWFKAYVTTGSSHQLSAISGALHVDLITEKDSIVRSLKLPLSAGMSMGDFVLEDELREGNYRIRAYTQWMRNAGEDYFFDHTFTVGSPVSEEVIGRSDYRYQTVDNKSVLTATLQYTDEEGKPLSGRNVAYDIMIDQQRAYSKSAKTDQQGNITVKISNENQADLRGAYIRTRIVSETASGKKEVTKDFPIKAGLAQSDVQFFPESGNLINGVTSKVAFKAIGIDGAGIMVTGKILDNENKEVADFESLKFGMGSFNIIPEAGKTYTAKIRFADSTEKMMPLPPALDEGYVLSVYQPNKDSILVRVSTSAKTLAAVQNSVNLSIIVQSGGATINASPVKISRQISSFWLDKSAFPTGIAQFTLFNAAGEPLNERIAFIRSKDQMQLSLSTAKKTYKSKEAVELELDAKDKDDKPTVGNFSVTVIDESKVPFEEERESTIFSNLLLTADLKGYIEKPNYYFTKDDEKVNKALDNLMLTQGYRRFSWKEIAGSTANSPLESNASIDPNTAYLTNAMFKPEGLGIDITGAVKTLGGKAVPNAKLMLLATKVGILQNATADANGRFKFEGLVLTDSIKFAVQARTEKNGTKVELVLDTVPQLYLSKNKNIADVNTNIAGTIIAYIDNSRKQDSIYEKTGQLNRVQRLKTVQITARKIPDQVYATQGAVRIGEGHADKTIDMKNQKPFANLGIFLRGLMPNVKFDRFYPEPLRRLFIDNYPHFYDSQTKLFVPMKIILDGREIREMEAAGVFDNTTLEAGDIAKIELVLTNRALINVLGAPAIMIYTKKDKGKGYNPNIANISPKGFNKVKVFYSPKYDHLNADSELPDLRTTIYWNANVKTYSTGKTKLNYFNADGPGNYKVIVEGINAEGEIGRQVYLYCVVLN
ncbi:hypothetical protein ACVWYN_000484 [Pedobacter sp. UYP24]